MFFCFGRYLRLDMGCKAAPDQETTKEAQDRLRQFVFVAQASQFMLHTANWSFARLSGIAALTLAAVFFKTRADYQIQCFSKRVTLAV